MQQSDQMSKASYPKQEWMMGLQAKRGRIGLRVLPKINGGGLAQKLITKELNEKYFNYSK